MSDPLGDILEASMTPLPTPRVELINGFEPNMVFTQNNGPFHLQDGMHRFTGVVLGERKDKARNSDWYAVWAIHYDQDLERWECTGGDYFGDLDQARFCFGRRLQHNCWGASVRGMKS